MRNNDTSLLPPTSSYYTSPIQKSAIFLLLCFIASLTIRAQTVACIGASITAGARIENPRQYAYPGQLQSLLGKQYIVHNFGVSGTTMLKKGNLPYWNTPAYQAALQCNPDIVCIDLGGNDAKAINRSFYGALEQDTKEMIRSFAKLASHPRV